MTQRLRTGEAAAVVSTDIIAVVAGVTHVVAYGYYVILALRGTTWPNPISWLMFAYGTTLVVVIETQAGASWRELLLPAVCALSSVTVAAIAWSRNGAAKALTKTDWWLFRADACLTIGYVGVWLAGINGALSPQGQLIATALFLLGTNATTFTSFMPLFLSALRDTTTEHPGPWMLWSIAYLLLLIATALNATGPESALLLIYPAINFILHTDIAALVFPARRVQTHD